MQFCTSQNIAVITASESKECETLFETRTAISNLLTIIGENKEIRHTFFPNETDVNNIIEKQYFVIDNYSKWWEKITKKYNLEAYNKNDLHLTFETNLITYICSPQNIKSMHLQMCEPK